MRIAFINTRADAVGGSQVHVRDVAEALLRRGHDVRAYVGGHGPVTEFLAQRGVPCVSLRHLVHTIHPYHDARAVPEMCRALGEFAPDLVSTHTSKAGVIGRAAARVLGIPALFTAHGWNFTDGIEECNRGFRVAMERLCSRGTAKVITVSESDRQLALRYGVVAPQKLITIHNGMPEVPAELRADPGARPARIVMVARFEAQKDHATLLNALGGLKDLSWELELIGGGPLMEQTQELARQLGIADRIQFAGPRNDVARRLAGAQVFALISNWEGLPRSIIEAMRAGLPVVASDVGGSCEMVLPGRTGYLVRRGDVEAVRSSLAKLIASPELRAELGANARRHYEDQFTFEAMFRKTVGVYHEVLASSRRHARRDATADRPKVVHVVEAYGAGTAEVIGQLTAGLPEYRHVIVCGRRPETTTVSQASAASGASAMEWRGVRREISLCNDVTAFLELLGTLRRMRGVSLVHAHAAKGGFHGRLAARVLGMRAALYTTHGSPVLRRDVADWKRACYRALERLGSRLAGTVVACSQSEYAALASAGIPATFVPNGVAADTSRPAKVPSEIIVGTVARAADQKDPAFFRRVAHEVRETAGVRFLWIGGGELTGELTGPNVSVTGWLSHRHMEQELSGLSVYLSTSTWEGLSMGVLHAMAMGKPLLLRRCTGNVDVVEHGVNGFLFDTVEQAVTYLKQLAADHALRQRMGQRSRQIFSEQFTAERMVEQYRELYRGLLAGEPLPLGAPRSMAPAEHRPTPADRRGGRRRPHQPLPATGSRPRQPGEQVLTSTR